MTYDIIYADPPWDYKGQKQHNGSGGTDTGGALNHYPTLKLSELKDITIPKSNNSLIFMWTSSPHLDQAIDLINHWDFSYSTIGFVWDKQKVNPGFYTMSQCEICLIGKHGTIPQPRGARNIKQFISSPRSAHSVKPEEVRNRIELMFPHCSKLEMFARVTTPGWDVFGNDKKVSDKSIKLTNTVSV